MNDLIGFVAEKVDFLELLIFYPTQREGLVPAMWENVERDLTPNGICQGKIGKLIFQGLNHCGSPPIFLRETIGSWEKDFAGYLPSQEPRTRFSLGC